MDEIKNTVEEAMEPAMDIVEASAGKTGMGALGFIVAGAGVVAATALVVKGIMWGVETLKEHQSKKELRKPDTIVEPTQEQLDEATK